MDIAVEVSAVAEEVRSSYGCISVLYLLSFKFCENMYIFYRMVCGIEGGTETGGIENRMLKSTLGIERKEVMRWLDRITQ
jgi:hypothetical protein